MAERFAWRLIRKADQDRFTAGRGGFGSCLHLDADPSELAFRPDATGEPRLNGRTHRWLHFDLSHSAGLVVFAVVRGRELGVDAEKVRWDFPAMGWRAESSRDRSGRLRPFCR